MPPGISTLNVISYKLILYMQICRLSMQWENRIFILFYTTEQFYSNLYWYSLLHQIIGKSPRIPATGNTTCVMQSSHAMNGELEIESECVKRWAGEHTVRACVWKREIEKERKVKPWVAKCCYHHIAGWMRKREWEEDFCV